MKGLEKKQKKKKNGRNERIVNTDRAKKLFLF